jgi:hypothetical protein
LRDIRGWLLKTAMVLKENRDYEATEIPRRNYKSDSETRWQLLIPRDELEI